MDIIKLPVQPRDKSMKAKQLLGNGLLPLEYYGSGVENKSFQVDYQVFRKTYRSAGKNTIIELKDEAGDTYNVLVHEIQYDPVRDTMKHVDLMNVNMGEAITTEVPLEFVGVAPAVKEMGGVLTSHLSEVTITCLPKDLIHSIEVDISALTDFSTFIRVEDLKTPETIEVMNTPEDVVITVVAPREEEPDEPVESEGDAAEGEEGGDEATSEEGGGDSAAEEGGE